MKILNMEKEVFKKLEKLYHFTSFDSCIKILLSNTLLFGRLCDLNDINELYRPLFSKTLEETDFDYVRNIISQYQQLSLTQDDKRVDKAGFDIPAMWGHYADKGRGACLVFNKAKLLKNKPSFVLQTGSVDYDKTYTPDIHFSTNKNGTLVPFTEQEIADLFFKKTVDWSYEQEFRIIGKNDINDHRLLYEIGDSLEGIILRRADDISPDKKIFSSRNFIILIKILGEKRINDELFWQRRIWEYNSFTNERNLCDFEGDSPWSVYS